MIWRFTARVFTTAGTGRADAGREMETAHSYNKDGCKGLSIERCHFHIFNLFW